MGQVSLAVDFACLRFRNPAVLASGILGYSRDSLFRVVEGGAGGVVTKSVGLEARVGYANPTVVQVEGGLVNAMGLPNPSIDRFVHDIQLAKQVLGVPVVVSVYGFCGEDYAVVAQKASKAGADGVELNVSCPHVGGTGTEVGQDPEVLEAVVRAVKSRVSCPLVVKLSPNVTDVVELARVAVEGGADGLTLVNTVRALTIDVETGLPILGNKRGGLSGPAMKPIALRCLFDVFEEVKVPLMGCGGVSNWRDAVEFLLAGASAIQIGSAIAFEGLNVFGKISRGVEAYLKKKGFGSVKEIVGYAHRD